MLQVLHKGRWVDFYPIISLEMVGEGDTIDPRKLEEFKENDIYGKYIECFVGYNPCWIFTSVSKNLLRNKI